MRVVATPTVAAALAAMFESRRRAPLSSAVAVAAVLAASVVAGRAVAPVAADAAPAVGDPRFSVPPKDPAEGAGTTPAVRSSSVISLAPDPRRVSGRVGGFETGDLSEFDGWSAVNGSLTVTRRRNYEGTHAARASNNASGNQFQRVWYRVRWRNASDVWYGIALYIPRLLDWCWWSPIRWDNYLTYGSAGDVGGVRIERGKLFLDRGDYTRQTPLIGPVAIPQGRWFWIEVHQRFSGTAGRAVSELYLDDVKRGSSTAPNSAGRVINHIRYGNVAMATRCSKRSSIYFDRVSVSRRRLGPRR
jgi:polysaccharide lyase-like protein